MTPSLLLTSELSSSSYGPPAHFLCGVGAGVLASLATQPADVVKTNVQLGSGLSTAAAVRHVYEVNTSKLWSLASDRFRSLTVRW